MKKKKVAENVVAVLVVLMVVLAITSMIPSPAEYSPSKELAQKENPIETAVSLGKINKETILGDTTEEAMDELFKVALSSSIAEGSIDRDTKEAIVGCSTKEAEAIVLIKYPSLVADYLAE